MITHSIDKILGPHDNQKDFLLFRGESLQLSFEIKNSIHFFKTYKSLYIVRPLKADTCNELAVNFSSTAALLPSCVIVV